MDGQKSTQAPDGGWERAKVIATIIDAVARIVDFALRR